MRTKAPVPMQKGLPNPLDKLVELLHRDFDVDLNPALQKLPPESFLRFEINATLHSHNQEDNSFIRVGSFDVKHREPEGESHQQNDLDNSAAAIEDYLTRNAQVSLPTPTPSSNDGDSPPSPKRRKENPTTRQLQPNSREFPQRKKRSDDVHRLQPSSLDKFVTGVWKQVYSSIKVAPPPNYTTIGICSKTGSSDGETFRDMNTLCLRITRMGKSFRALETIVQAHWVDCFEARVKTVADEKSFLSNTEVRMFVLREACSVLKWSEKELRNRLAIWRGYKEIKDAGGWVTLVFAGSGVYRFCKYRTGFGASFTTRLIRLQPSLEVAADTIHPEWRRLLAVIGKESPSVYIGHPHDWVLSDNSRPVRLESTYTQWDPEFEFQHLEESVLDECDWPDGDPRKFINSSLMFCSHCGYLQSNIVAKNECRCFPELYGSCKAPCAVQIVQSSVGKNNGLMARCDFARGSAIGEFVGLITRGMDDIDVMQSGSGDRKYQIYQGKMGNYTRFINHSCAPNSQFQKFCWLGTERVVLVSKGIHAGTEITVDYSNDYWEGLDKVCLCGEGCCRYSKKSLVV